MKRSKQVQESTASVGGKNEDKEVPPSKSIKRSNPFFGQSNLTKVNPKVDDEDELDDQDVETINDVSDGDVESSDSDLDDDDEDDDDSIDEDDSDGDSDSDDDSDELGVEENADVEAGVDKGGDEDEEDPLIVALKKSKEKQPRKSPPDIKFKAGNLMDITFHPKEDLIVCSQIDGDMSMFQYTNEFNKLRKKLNLHKSTVRTVEFDSDGRFLCSGSKDKSFKMTDIETSKVVYKCAKAHSSALYKVKPLTVNLIATGDEDGTVKLWDNRIKNGDDGSVCWSSVMESKKFDEFVSDIFFDPDVDDKMFVASSGEGTILSFNMRGKRPDLQSEVYEGEMNALAVVHKNSKLVAGCGDGRLYMFDWRQFGYHSADFPGHPDAINHLIAATDNVVITACEDGTIRAVHLYPHRFIGTVGHHEGSFPVERLDMSASGELIASISHDQCIKFWNIKYLEEMEYDRRPKPFHQRKIKMRRKENKMQRAKEIEYQLPSSHRGNKKDFFKGLDDENND